MKATTATAGLLAGLGLAGMPAGPAPAQSRVVVPIVIQAPRSPSPSARPPSIRVTTRTTTPAPGVTATRVTVGETAGAGRRVGPTPAPRTLATVPVGTPSVLVTIDRRRGPDGSGGLGQTRVTVEDVSASNRAADGPAPLSLRSAGSGQATLVITSDAPIEAPIVILGP
jgi:hypothetical protein